MAKQKERYVRLYDALCQLERASNPFTIADLARNAGYKASSLAVYKRNKLNGVYIFADGNGAFTAHGVCAQSVETFADHMCQKSSMVHPPSEAIGDPYDPDVVRQDPFQQRILTRIFRNTCEDGHGLSNGEDDWLEYKGNYSYPNREDYAKTMAAFANAHGGYLVFGVQNRGREASGMSNDNFSVRFDPSKLTQYLQKMFSPTIRWTHCIHEIGDRTFGLIYAYACSFKPVIVVRTEGKFKDSTIYYRYSGESKPIQSGDLLRILNERAANQDARWRDMIQNMATLTPQNADILDLSTGRIGNTPILIDMRAMEQIKFIKEGEFREREGDPTLKLIGEVEGVSGAVVVPREVPVSNLGKMRAGIVAERVKAAIGKPFVASSHHVKCWRYYKVRPSNNDPHPTDCNTEYCCYNPPYKDYLYTEAWVRFLVSKLSDDTTYDKVMRNGHVPTTNS